MCWKIEKETFGWLPRIRVFTSSLPDRQALSILKQRMGLVLIQRFIFMKTEPVISGSDQAVTMGNLFETLPQKMDFPVTVFVYCLKTKPASFGLVHKEKICSFMMEKHLRF